MSRVGADEMRWHDIDSQQVCLVGVCQIEEVGRALALKRRHSTGAFASRGTSKPLIVVGSRLTEAPACLKDLDRFFRPHATSQAG